MGACMCVLALAHVFVLVGASLGACVGACVRVRVWCMCVYVGVCWRAVVCIWVLVYVRV